MIKMISSLWSAKAKNNLNDEAAILRAVDKNKLPRHIAIIMDGNGRWAIKHGKPRYFGHRAGVESLREVVKLCSELKIQVLTCYAFSTENWKRPREEVNILMNLLVEYLSKELRELHKNNVKINPIGRIDQLPPAAQQALHNAVEQTAANDGLVLNLALNYGGRTEIVDACRGIAEEITRGQLKPAEIDEQKINEHLYTAGLPDPDLLIRPSGDHRISNFLLWQLAYTEFWLTPVMWPEFRRIHLLQAILEFQQRDRRFGGLKKK